MPAPLIRNKNIVPYRQAWAAMQDFCDHRTADTADEIWLLQHPPIYTLGQAADRTHLLRDNGIAVIQSDRGGQITYHGLGQLVAYLLIDIRRRHLGLRALVRKMENAVIRTLADYDIRASGDEKAPGVYVHVPSDLQSSESPPDSQKLQQSQQSQKQKIAALGLRVRRGGTYHGLSLNVNMDLAPFADINPCGYAGLSVTQIADLHHPAPTIDEVSEKLAVALQEQLS